MLRRSNFSLEAPMFSLIAIYFEYRKAGSSRALTPESAAGQPARPDNDAGSDRAVPTAA